MKTAVLITCYNRVETTLRCLRQFFAQIMPDGMECYFYLVDDASPDRTGEKVKAEFPHVNVIMGTGRLFWCKGMRLAWDTAIKSGIDYDFYLWLNDDVQLLEGALASVFSDSDKIVTVSGKYGIVVGAFSQAENVSQATYGLWDKNNEIVQPNGEPQWVDGYGMNGNLVLIPKAIYEAVGPIYDGYCHGVGDFDYRLMARGKGYLAYSSSRLCGVCPRQSKVYDKLCYEPILKRFKALFSPYGRPLKDTFVFRMRHWGFWRAVISCVHVVYLVVWPPKHTSS